jgi:hypothetical protein
MGKNSELWAKLRGDLTEVLHDGMATDPLEHAAQVAQVASILRTAFSAGGFEVTLVGGSAIEVHAPGIYRSGDLDVVIERARRDADRREEIFVHLGFLREGRHWRFEEELFVEVVHGPVAGPAEEVRLGDYEFRVVSKESVLRDRLVGFKQWKYTAYGQQAIDMLSAFGADLDRDWLEEELQREGSLDALGALEALAASREEVTEASLRKLLEDLHGRTV